MSRNALRGVAERCPTQPDDGRAERMRAMRYYSTQRPVAPESSSTSTRQKDIYNDWFDSREAALKHIEEAKKA